MTATLNEANRAWLERELAAECRRAKREMPRVGSDQHPTRWDVRHSDLDLLLTKWEAAN